MAAGATKDYAAIPNKRQWRRWVWNRARDLLLERRPGEANVVGLFGADGLDVEYAEEKGFDRRRMISIEANREAVSVARRRSQINTIRGELSAVLRAWPDETVDGGIHVLIADLCGGLSTHGMKVCRALLSSRGINENCVVVVNLLRGRDQVGARWVYGLDATVGGLDQSIAPRKHRGMWFYLLAMKLRDASLAALADEAGCSSSAVAQALERVERPSTFTYRSGNLVYDSIAFRLASQFHGHPPVGSHGVRRRIAAAKAVRTMRTASKLS